MTKNKLEFYNDDNDSPIGLLVRHNRQNGEEYEDEDHAVFVDFREENAVLDRPKVKVKDKKSLEEKKTDKLSIEEEIECFCGFKCKVTDGKVIPT